MLVKEKKCFKLRQRWQLNFTKGCDWLHGDKVQHIL